MRREVRRRWYLGLIGAGVVGALIVVAAAAGASAADRPDTLRAGGASVILLGGLVTAIGLGARAYWGDIQNGALGAAAAAGAPRATIATSRALSRVSLLGVALVVWTAVLVVGGAIVGHGVDGTFIVHGLAQYETLTFTALAAGATSTVLGPWVAGTVGLMTHITAQATVNLAAAADAGQLGTASRLAHVAYNVLPHAIVSPMVSRLQNRDAGGPAAPQFQINNIPIPSHPSSLGSVLWTLAWCGIAVWLCFVGLRRRNLN